MLKTAFVCDTCKVFAQIEKIHLGRIYRVVRCKNGIFDGDPNKQFIRINNIDFSVEELRRSGFSVNLYW